MKHRVLAALSAAAALALGGGVAQAHNRTFETNVGFQDAYNVGNLTGFAGQVSSQRAQCVSNREVRVFKIVNGSRELVDVARTSDNGAFAGVGDFDNAEDALAKVTRKNIGGSNHRHICGKATDSFNDNNVNP